MKIQTLLTLVFLCMPLVLFGIESPIPVTFQQLSDQASLEQAHNLFHHQHIAIRGFLYQSGEGDWILASEPNLKSCCLGSPQKVWQQIAIYNEPLSAYSHQAVTMEGTLLIKPEWNEQHHLKKVYELENASIIPLNKNWGMVFKRAILGIAAIIAVIFFLIRTMKKQA